MKSKSVLIAVVCLLALAAAQWPWTEEPRKPQKPRAQVYALEGLGALAGTVGCCLPAVCGVGLMGPNLWVFLPPVWLLGDPDTMSVNAGQLMVGACVSLVSAAVLPAAAGYGAAKVGEQRGEDGSTGGAIGGAYFGTAAGVGLGLVGGAVSRSNAVRITSWILGGLCIPSGAVLGYNRGINRGASTGSFTRRLSPPGVALTGVELPDHSVEYGVRVQLAGLRF